MLKYIRILISLLNRTVNLIHYYTPLYIIIVIRLHAFTNNDGDTEFNKRCNATLDMCNQSDVVIATRIN